MDVQLLESLLYREESETLDFKRDQYPFDRANDDERAELLKDLLGGWPTLSLISIPEGGGWPTLENRGCPTLAFFARVGIRRRMGQPRLPLDLRFYSERMGQPPTRYSSHRRGEILLDWAITRALYLLPFAVSVGALRKKLR
jgi:hypothetical protein